MFASALVVVAVLVAAAVVVVLVSSIVVVVVPPVYIVHPQDVPLRRGEEEGKSDSLLLLLPHTAPAPQSIR